MADDLFDEEVFEELLAYSRRSEVNFGFALGKKLDESVLVFHKRKGGAELARKAKKLDDVSSKTAFGTAGTKGKLLTLNCEEYVPGMKKALKQTFKKKGLQMKVNIVPPPGVEMDPEDAEQDVDDESPVGVGADEVESEEAESETEEVAEDRLARLTQELKAIVPQVTTVSTADPARRDDLVTLVREATANIKSRQADAAEESITRLRELLSQPAAPPPAPPPPPGDPQLKQQLLQALPKITPAVARVLNSPDAEDAVKRQLRELVDQLKSHIKSSQLAEAKQDVGRIVELVKLASKPDAGPSAEEAEFNRRWEALSPRLQEAKRANPERSSALDYNYQSALELAQGGDFDRAGQTLDRLEKQIEDALSSAPRTDTERHGIREGLVAERVAALEKYFRARIEEAKAATRGEMGQVERAVAQEEGDPNPAGLTEDISAALDELYDDVHEALSDALASASTEQILGAVDEWRKKVAADPLVRHMQKAKTELGCDPAILDKFEDLFQDVTDRVNQEAVPA